MGDREDWGDGEEKRKPVWRGGLEEDGEKEKHREETERSKKRTLRRGEEQRRKRS